MIVAPFFVSLLVSFFCVPILITRLKRAGIFGSDIHKPDQPKAPEMGGLAIVVGFGSGILLAVAMVSFFHVFPSVKPCLSRSFAFCKRCANIIGPLKVF